MYKAASFKTWLLITLIFLAGALFRIFSLNNVPIFADEAIYIRWAQVMRAESTLRFLPLSDGKQPLFMWIIIPFLKLIPTDPLFAGRLVSVLSGLGSVVGITILAHLVYKNRSTTFFSLILASLCPYLIFFDRFALVDSLLAFLGTWTFVLALITAKTHRLDTAMITGFFLGFSLLTKSPAQLFTLMLPLPFLLYGLNHQASLKGKTKSVISNSFLLLVIYLIAISMYNILRLGPQFHMISLRNKDYVFPLSEIVKHPLTPIIPNTSTAVSYLGYFLTPPVILLALVGVVTGLRKKATPTLYLIILFLVPFMAQNLIAKVLTARYFLYVIPFFLILSASGASFILNNKRNTRNKLNLSIFVVFFLFSWPIILSFLLVTKPETQNLPQSEKSGYFELWTAGYGIREVANYLKQQPTKPILVGTEGYFGTLPDGLQMYLNDFRHIRIIGIGLFPDHVPESLSNSLIDNDVYLVINDSRLSIKNPALVGLSLINSYPKTANSNRETEHLLFFKLNAPIQPPSRKI